MEDKISLDDIFYEPNEDIILIVSKCKNIFKLNEMVKGIVSKKKHQVVSIGIVAGIDTNLYSYELKEVK